jgi:LysR family transcriptional regulator, glycine cleavage system transcriptional activator
VARRLPSLNALKAFEAAARHVSFTEAAGELFVTHAAISRHIRELEEHLGTQLFLRTGRGVALTEAGKRFGEQLTPLFDALSNASREAAAVGAARPLNVSVEPAIASRWLVPRLGHFRELHPDIELNIDPTNRLVDFRVDEVELGIRYGRGHWEDVEMTKLSSNVVIFPVCAPALIAGVQNLKPEDLKNYNLLHEQRKQWWADWLNANGIEGVTDWKGTVFQNHLAIEAAESGQGFALGDQILCTDSILEGWLARPFALEMKDHGNYWIVRAKGSKETATARSFREWLTSEMAGTNKKFAALKALSKPAKQAIAPPGLFYPQSNH